MSPLDICLIVYFGFKIDSESVELIQTYFYIVG